MRPPIRVCCGTRHNGPVCPDGRVMCCLCFSRVTQDRLNRLPDGSLEDACIPCAAEERHPTPPKGVPVTTYKISGGGPSTAGCMMTLVKLPFILLRGLLR